MHRILPPTRRWPLHSVASTRRIEAAAAGALTAHTLMRRAGEAVASLTLAVAPHAQRVWIAAGPGNNGGDGLAAAARLQAAGRQVLVTWFGAAHSDRRTPADALDAHQCAVAAGVSIIDHVPPSSQTFDIAIDALLGIGANRAPTGPMAESVALLNRGACPVLAIDLPSGLDADSGRWLGDGEVPAGAGNRRRRMDAGRRALQGAARRRL